MTYSVFLFQTVTGYLQWRQERQRLANSGHVEGVMHYTRSIESLGQLSFNKTCEISELILIHFLMLLHYFIMRMIWSLGMKV